MSSSPAVPLPELLLYLPKYKVVVCATCQYAVQPGAITRHLKEIHHIHRGKRRPYMQYISEFQLNSPCEVLNVKISEFPVPNLPVLDGLSCRCGHLCVSVKRMRNHWYSVHGRSGLSNLDWYPTPLQTFFRGNLLQYFTRPWPGDDAARVEYDMNNSKAASISPHSCGRFNSATLERDDMLLLQHYLAFTSLTLANDDETRFVWQVTIPKLAECCPFLFHGVLACSALHKAHLEQENRRKHTLRAIAHHDQALPLFRAAIANPDQDNCNSTLVFAHLLVICSFAMEQNDDPLLLVGDNGLNVMTAWLRFLRSGCSMLCDYWEELARGPLKCLVGLWEIPIEDVSEISQSTWTSYLLSMIPLQALGSAWPEKIVNVYREAADSLGHAFACTEALSSKFTTWDALRIWPLHISKAFVCLLSEEHPAALILLAHYCLLL